MFWVFGLEMSPLMVFWVWIFLLRVQCLCLGSRVCPFTSKVFTKAVMAVLAKEDE